MTSSHNFYKKTTVKLEQQNEYCSSDSPPGVDNRKDVQLSVWPSPSKYLQPARRCPIVVNSNSKNNFVITLCTPKIQAIWEACLHTTWLLFQFFFFHLQQLVQCQGTERVEVCFMFVEFKFSLGLYAAGAKKKKK